MDIVESNCFGGVNLNPPVELPIREYILEKDWVYNNRRNFLVANAEKFERIDLGAMELLFIPDNLNF